MKVLPTEIRCRELEKAITLILPLAEKAARETSIQQSEDWAHIANAKAVLAGALSIPEAEVADEPQSCAVAGLLGVAVIALVLFPLLLAAALGWWDLTRDMMCPSWLASGRTHECRDWPIWRRP